MLCHVIQGALQSSACNSKHQASLSTTTSTPLSMLCNSTLDSLQLHLRRSATPPSMLCNSTFDSLQLHLRRSATPPSMLCNSTFDALQLHLRRSATPPSTLCNSTFDALQPRGGPTPSFWDATWPHVLVVHPVNICTLQLQQIANG